MSYDDRTITQSAHALRTLKLAAVQAAPVWLDRDGSIAKACRLIEEAGASGASVVGFPENFIPGHPYWFYFEPASARRSLDFAERLFHESVDIDGGGLSPIQAAAKRARISVVLGVTERTTLTAGTLFNTQVFIDSKGRVGGRHRKIVATSTERLVHGPGTPDTQQSFNSGFGPISSLICGENTNPLAVARVASEYPMVHVASWPSSFSKGYSNMRESALLASRSVAYTCCCFVILAASVYTTDVVTQLAREDEDEKYMLDETLTGGASIIGPAGTVIAGPAAGGGHECTVYAEADLNKCIRMRMVHDYAGHYNRPDIYHLTVNRDARPLVSDGSEGT